MSKYMIHACNDRMWYVNDYLIPSMLKQGIKEEDIVVWQDTECRGNLFSFIDSCRQLALVKDKGTWHLQDDVLICSDFKEKTEKYDEGIVCGFTTQYDDVRSPGEYKAKDNIWWSFPCIRIPNEYLADFVSWVDIWVWRDPQWEKWILAKKGDDLVFNTWAKNYRPNDRVLCLAPNLVEHVDWLIGGTTVNHARQKNKGQVRSIHWTEEYLVLELKKKLEERNH